MSWEVHNFGESLLQHLQLSSYKFSNLFMYDAASKKCDLFWGVSGSLPQYDPIFLKS